MNTKKIFVFLFDGYSDWEIAYLAPEIKKNDNFQLKYFSADGGAVMSMGGLKVNPDLALADINSSEIDALIIPGGTAWEKNEIHAIDALVLELNTQNKTIAAICAATTHLARLGLFAETRHTSNDYTYLKFIVPNYSGEENYVNSPAVRDRNLITANGIATIEFARELFAELELFDDVMLEKWYQLFKHGIWSY
jgi:putative intracellular protease/amidase